MMHGRVDVHVPHRHDTADEAKDSCWDRVMCGRWEFHGGGEV